MYDYRNKIINKNIANILQYFSCFQTLIHYGQFGFIHALHGCFNTTKSVNVIHNINKLRENMFISINPKKAFRKPKSHS